MLDHLVTHACDVILTDINMGHMDGYNFGPEVNGDQALADVSEDTGPSVRLVSAFRNHANTVYSVVAGILRNGPFEPDVQNLAR